MNNHIVYLRALAVETDDEVVAARLHAIANDLRTKESQLRLLESQVEHLYNSVRSLRS